MMIPSGCHLTLYDTGDCVANPLPLLDLPIVGQSDKQVKAMIHGDEGIGVDGLKELDPGCSSHDSIHDGDIMEQAQSNIHYELVPPPPVASNHIISAFQQGYQAFPLVKAKTSDVNTSGHTYFPAHSFNYGERLICCLGTR
jgi:hypothetical protein